MPATADWVAAGTVSAVLRATSRTTPGIRTLSVRAVQDNGAVATARGNFEIVRLATENGMKARNLIIMIGDGMGIAHRTAARVMLHGVTQGKTFSPLAMDAFPATALVRTASLNSLLTDSSPGASAYATGNKADNGQVGVFPDDTRARFDNPRVEHIAEYLARTQGKWLGIVTTADVTDATPSAFAAHSQERIAGCGIADAYLDEAVPAANLRVLLGGGRGTFLPNTTPGSVRVAEWDYELPAELAAGWNVNAGQVDPGRDLLADFRAKGFKYAATRTQLSATGGTARLLGLFAFGHMNSAMDKLAKRRGRPSVVDDFGLPDQPMLDEMTDAALGVLKQNPAGFVLLVEGALIDKYSHAMDTERWIHEVIEFDRAVGRARAFAEAVPDTLVVVTADHETGGANVIGASRFSQTELASRAATGGGISRLRDELVVNSTPAGFPNYVILDDGYPDTADVNRRMLVGYAANADRYEDWMANARPVGGPGNSPATPLDRDKAGGLLITGQIPGSMAGHTGSDVPLSAFGVGASNFSGAFDNTEVFFRMAQLAIGGTGSAGAPPAAPVRMDSNPQTATERLTNLSSRGIVGSGAESMVNGFVLTGARPHRLLIRGLGPALADLGVPGPLPNPELRIRDAKGVVLFSNDNWESNDNVAALQSAILLAGGVALAPGSHDAALLVDLAPGTYTAELVGSDGGSGVGLLEIYEVR
jgi:alkaline phosphatase